MERKGASHVPNRVYRIVKPQSTAQTDTLWLLYIHLLLIDLTKPLSDRLLFVQINFAWLTYIE